MMACGLAAPISLPVFGDGHVDREVPFCVKARTRRAGALPCPAECDVRMREFAIGGKCNADAARLGRNHGGESDEWLAGTSGNRGIGAYQHGEKTCWASSDRAPAAFID